MSNIDKGLRKSMVRIDRLREDSEKRILRCSEGRVFGIRFGLTREI